MPLLICSPSPDRHAAAKQCAPRDLGPKSLRVGLAVAAALYAAIVAADQAKYKAPSTIVALLPTYCMHQYVDDVDGPEYSTPLECGPGMNHYCPGLVKLHQAGRTVGNKRERMGLLERAKDDTEYTLKAMQNYPSCPLRKDVEATFLEIEHQLRLYNIH